MFSFYFPPLSVSLFHELSSEVVLVYSCVEKIQMFGIRYLINMDVACYAVFQYPYAKY